MSEDYPVDSGATSVEGDSDFTYPLSCINWFAFKVTGTVDCSNGVFTI